MKKITRQEFREAMIVVETYCDQIGRGSVALPHEIGCPVVLSEYGKEVEKENKSRRLLHKKGVVVDWLEWHGIRDGLVTVKWDGIQKPEMRHISQVKAI